MNTDIKDRIDRIRQHLRGIFLDQVRDSFEYILDTLEKSDDFVEKEKILLLIEKDLREKDILNSYHFSK